MNKSPSALTQRFERMAVVIKQIIAIFGQQRWPGVRTGDQARLVVRRLCAFVGHLEKQQIGELLDVIAIAHAVIAQSIAIVPEFLNQRGSVHGCPIEAKC